MSFVKIIIDWLKKFFSSPPKTCPNCQFCLDEKPTLIDNIGQFAIPFFSGLAIYLIAQQHPIGFGVGLIAQPFWYHTSIKNKQWGIFWLTTFFVGSYLLGIKNAFYPGLW